MNEMKWNVFLIQYNQSQFYFDNIVIENWKSDS